MAAVPRAHPGATSTDVVIGRRQARLRDPVVIPRGVLAWRGDEGLRALGVPCCPPPTRLAHTAIGSISPATSGRKSVRISGPPTKPDPGRLLLPRANSPYRSTGQGRGIRFQPAASGARHAGPKAHASRVTRAVRSRIENGMRGARCSAHGAHRLSTERQTARARADGRGPCGAQPKQGP